MRIGAIFDWDGVIVDSSHIHEKSWELLAEDENLTLPQGHFRKGFGMKNEYIISEILHWSNNIREINRLSHCKENLYREIVAKETLQPLPGVVGFLTMLMDLDIPCAIGSSTPMANIQLIIDKLEINEFFSGIVSGDDVTKGKPNPQVFYMAAQKIYCQPEQCIVFEDAPAGIAAAHNGGMKAVAIASTHAQKSLRDADIVVHSFEELHFNKLRNLIPSSRQPVN